MLFKITYLYFSNHSSLKLVFTIIEDKSRSTFALLWTDPCTHHVLIIVIVSVVFDKIVHIAEELSFSQSFIYLIFAVFPVHVQENRCPASIHRQRLSELNRHLMALFLEILEHLHL